MGKQYRDNEINGEGHVLDLLSAYIDRSLDEPERERVRAHIEGCADCRAAYVELQATMRMVQNMPVAAVPRAFTLTPEMAARVRKPSLLERIFSPKLAPTFATGSVVAFVMLFFLFAGSGFLNPDGFAPAASNPAALSAPTDDAARQVEPSEGEGNDAMSIAAAPTPTTAAFGGSAEDSSEKMPGEPTQPTAEAAVPLVPAGTPLPVGSGGGLPEEQVTPNTAITDSGTSSPTTVAIDPAPPAPGVAGSGTTENQAYSTESEAPAQQTTLAQSQPGQDMNLLLAAEIGLLVLGLALAAAAIIARLRAA